MNTYEVTVMIHGHQTQVIVLAENASIDSRILTFWRKLEGAPGALEEHSRFPVENVVCWELMP